MKKVEKLLPTAIKVIEDVLAKNGEIANEYNGYVSNFGASVIQSGLMPTIAFFENPNKNTEPSKYKFSIAILKILQKEYGVKENRLIDLAIEFNKNSNLSILKKNINDVVIALKLGLRTFKKMEDKNE